MEELACLKSGLTVHPLPPPRSRDPNLPHAPTRVHGLSLDEQKLSICNALRYFPEECHSTLAAEFAQELKTYGHIYMYRFRPSFRMKAYPLKWYPTRLPAAAAIIHMIMNNLDPDVAQFPEELVTYGENGQTFSNWAQFWLVVKYLCEMDNDQTLVIYSGHPMGLFPSSFSSPRMVITNGMVIPNYSSQAEYVRMFALNVSMYGQMTAGSYSYIGPQGIVHGTMLTILNAARKYLKLDSLAGKVFVSSGCGGMSGAQAKAAVICGCIAVIADVNFDALQKRFKQHWLQEMYTSMDDLIARLRTARKEKDVTSIGYHGNVVTLWERLVHEYKETGECLVDLGSDQTSCHNPYNGGYYPVQVPFEEAQSMLANDPKKFRNLVQESLRKHISAINVLTGCGMKFWDYGNAFLLEASRAGADVLTNSISKCPTFRYPSYVQDIMGDIFSLGFGPFRWICTSASPDDLKKTDEIALRVLLDIVKAGVPKAVQQQYDDNIQWIKNAAQHDLVVGSQARILYSDQFGRIQLALAFNKAVAAKTLQGPVVITRDHHDVSGTDSPFRETSNIQDGSNFTADMAVQNCIGDAFRGATWVSLHNGGGVGWGEVINGGFGLVLDGSNEACEKAKLMLQWDVSNGVARRSWAGNIHAYNVIRRTMQHNPKLRVTLPNAVQDESIFNNIL